MTLLSVEKSPPIRKQSEMKMTFSDGESRVSSSCPRICQKCIKNSNLDPRKPTDEIEKRKVKNGNATERRSRKKLNFFVVPIIIIINN
jgi:hypothetical protein